jgi:glycosyltransferase involved in cell wall biosynthesis
VGGAPDVVIQHETGRLIPPDDIPALQQAVLTLSGDPECRMRMGIRAREHIRQHYSLPMIADRLKRLYIQCLGV